MYPSNMRSFNISCIRDNTDNNLKVELKFDSEFEEVQSSTGAFEYTCTTYWT